jgi:3'-phosphoadenosine 5'-phosphosulfate (PAPS) 3'-phosphatase
MMTDSVVISLVGAAATVLVAVVNAVFAYLGARRGKRTERHVAEAKNSLETLKQQTNGMQERLLEVTAKAEHAKGVKQAEDEAAGICRYKAADDSCKFPGPGNTE